MNEWRLYKLILRYNLDLPYLNFSKFNCNLSYALSYTNLPFLLFSLISLYLIVSYLVQLYRV